jgi:hypothetical protein
MNKMKIKTALLATSSRDGKPYIDKNGKPFKMLHVQLLDDRWASKYYKIDDEVIVPNQQDEVAILIKRNGQYYNIVDYFILTDKQNEILKENGYINVSADDMLGHGDTGDGGRCKLRWRGFEFASTAKALGDEDDPNFGFEYEAEAEIEYEDIKIRITGHTAP